MFLQTRANFGSSDSFLHVHHAVCRLRASVESGCNPTRRHLQENVVEKFPVHSQLFRVRKHGKFHEHHFRKISIYDHRFNQIDCLVSHAHASRWHRHPTVCAVATDGTRSIQETKDWICRSGFRSSFLDCA